MGLWRRTNGNMAMIFALALVPIVMVIGFSIDSSRQYSAATALQKAVDAAVLSAAQSFTDTSLTEEQRIQLAKDLVNSNFSGHEDVTLNVPVVTFPETNAIRIAVSGSIPTTATSLMGVSDLDINGSAAARWTSPSTLETVLVLDTTGSMEGTPLADLKTAAQTFVQDLIDPERPDIRVGIVPFAQYVNVGTGYRSADWINVPADYSKPYSHCSVDEDDYEDAGCSCVSQATHSWTDPETGETSTWTSCASWSCPSGEPEEECASGAKDFTWYGCVRSRAMPYDIQDTRWDIDAEGFLGTNSNDCPSAITPLTNVQGTLTSEINALVARGWTYIPAGLAWGRRVLSPEAPFDEAMDAATFASKKGKRLMILMSDGANTKSLDTDDGFHTDEDVDAANARTLAACTEVKNAGIDLFVIAFNLTDPDTITMLQTCASTFEHYSAATDLASLTDAFEAASASVSSIALYD